MTALSEIGVALEKAKAKREGQPLLRRKPLMIRVGDSAMRAICAETSDKKMPGMISGVPVSLTSEFRGWDIQEV